MGIEAELFAVLGGGMPFHTNYALFMILIILSSQESTVKRSTTTSNLKFPKAAWEMGRVANLPNILFFIKTTVNVAKLFSNKIKSTTVQV